MSGAVELTPLDGGGGAPTPGASPLYPLKFEKHSCTETPENTRANIVSAVARKLTPFIPCPIERPGTVLIVASSPSLRDYVITIRDRQSRGDVIFAVNQAHDYLIEMGIVPDFCVTLDAVDELARIVNPLKGVTYLVASMCHPDYFDRIAGYDTILWHAWNNTNEEELLASLKEPRCIVYGGGTAALRCINLGFLMGFRKFALYGVDSSFADDGRYYAHESRYERPWYQPCITIWCKGRKFETNIGLASQAEDFRILFNVFAHECDIQAYGDGLIPWMCKHLNESKSKILEREKLSTTNQETANGKQP